MAGSKVLLCLLAVLAVTQARMPRNQEERKAVGVDVRDNKRESHEFFVLVSNKGENTMEHAEHLAKEFKKRLGEDNHVKVSAVSKDKLYVHIRGDTALADRLTSAMKSFNEVQFVERKPQYKTRERVGGRGTRRDRNEMKERVPAGQEAPKATM